MDFSITAVEQLGPTLRGLRKARGLSQQEVADRSGLTQKTVSQLETRPNACSVATLMKYLSIVQASVALRETAAQPAAEDSW